MNLYRQKLTGWDTFVDEDTNGIFPYVAATSNPDAGQWDDVTSIENWDAFGVHTTLTAYQIREEIKALFTTWGSHTSAEKVVFAKWFCVDKAQRDEVRTATEQELDAYNCVLKSFDSKERVLINEYVDNLATGDTTYADFLANKLKSEWQPPTIALSSFLNNGVLSYLNPSGAGYHKSFPENVDSSVVTTLPLRSDGINYDGSSLKFEIAYSLYSLAPGGSDDVKFDINYTFLKADGTENPYTLLDGTINETIDVSTLTANIEYVFTTQAITGKADATHLLITITRNGQGTGSDIYGQNVDVHNIKLLKV